jgi:hypothetical protein
MDLLKSLFRKELIDETERTFGDEFDAGFFGVKWEEFD